MLIEQHHLIEAYSSQGQQLRPLQALDGHLHSPLQDVLEQAVEGFKGWRPQLMKDLAHFYPSIAMWMRPTARRHQFPAALLALVPPLGIIIVGVTQYGAYLPGQLVQPARGYLIVASIRDGHLGGQWEPHCADGHGAVQLPPIPPAVPARLAPACFGLNRRMGDDALLPMFFVPDASSRLQWRPIDRHSAALRSPWVELAHQGAPHAAE